MKTFLTSLALACATQAFAAGPYNAVVDAAGSGDYLTVSEAIAAAPDSLTSPWLILVKPGAYEEHFTVPASKPYIHLIGTDAATTSIHYMTNIGKAPEELPRHDKTAYWLYSIRNPRSSRYGHGMAVVVVEAPHFLSHGISYVNDWGVESYSGPQALAMYSNADCVAFSRCAFRSFQDTWRTADSDSARNYAADCLIEGAVDYMYGGGDAYVDSCTFYNVRGGSVIVAPNHGTPEYGYVMDRCVIDGNSASADGRQKLGRPWKGNPKAVWLNTTALIPIAPEGWSDMGAIPAVFAEYNTMLRDGTPVDLSARKSSYTARGTGETGSCANTLTAAEASRYTYDNVVKGADGWDPRAMTAVLPAPRNITLTDGLLSWNPVDGAAGYMVCDGNDIIGLVSEPSFRLETPVKVSLKVRAINPWGVPGNTGI